MSPQILLGTIDLHGGETFNAILSQRCASLYLMIFDQQLNHRQVIASQQSLAKDGKRRLAARIHTFTQGINNVGWQFPVLRRTQCEMTAHLDAAA